MPVAEMKATPTIYKLDFFLKLLTKMKIWHENHNIQFRINKGLNNLKTDIVSFRIHKSFIGKVSFKINCLTKVKKEQALRLGFVLIFSLTKNCTSNSYICTSGKDLKE